LGWPTRVRALAFTAFTVEKIFFLGRFFGILCVWLIQISCFCARVRDGLNRGLTYKLAPCEGGDVKYFHWNFFDWSLGQWKNASFSMKSRSCGSIR
jgi:hypothetical protein